MRRLRRRGVVRIFRNLESCIARAISFPETSNHDRAGMRNDAPCIRIARPDDRPAIEAMHFLSVHGLNSNDYTPPQIEAFIGYFGTYDPSLIDDGTYFVAEQEGRIVASGGWSRRMPVFETDEGEQGVVCTGISADSAKIRSIFVHPQHTRRGLGSQLVRLSEERAVAAGCRLLELWATLTGVPLYRKLGYEEVGRLPFTAPDVAPLMSVHMAKVIPADAKSASAA